ncbi:cytochrome P450 [Kitasatospora sp. GP30]|uniref:cytochrome P450 n=1 Tax=Kitasatospora sp. GP30 TaxID=3035084 RepID=UPI000CB5B732|nr:cytochrome P450 [Kitasatospora sp. GP30]MDH6141956.1 cytochrome P450 [Kitasatospora sp. GP30]
MTAGETAAVAMVDGETADAAMVDCETAAMAAVDWTRARRLDRRVYLRSHPVLFTLLCATRRRPVVRLGRTVLVHGTTPYLEVLTRVPLDRAAPGTTGGVVAQLTGGGQLFDQDGPDHRAARRSTATELSAAALHTRLRPLWQAALAELLDAARADGLVDLVDLAEQVAGVTAATLTGSRADPRALARAATAAAAAAARDHLPGLRPHREGVTTAAVAALGALLPDPADAMLVVAAVNTTRTALPRAAAWCADANHWPNTEGARGAQGAQSAHGLAVELLRRTAPAPLLPRVAAADAIVAGVPIRAGDRLLLVTRHAAQAHRPAAPATAATTQAVFGAGPHACPGAGLARAQLADFLLALAPYRPTVVRREVDRRAALPGYRALVVRLRGAEVAHGQAGTAGRDEPGSRTDRGRETPCE